MSERPGARSSAFARGEVRDTTKTRVFLSDGKGEVSVRR